MADSAILQTLQKHKERLDALENGLAALKAQLAGRPDPKPAPAPKRTKERRPAAPVKPAPPAERKPDPPAAPKRKSFFDEF